MITPRVAAIHDLSGFGRCSLTVAIPILSAMGVQCCPLPTAFLSTHTGGFTGFTFLDMTEEMPKVAAHWKSLGLRFQAIYSGFLGSEAQIGIVEDFIRTFRTPETLVVVDPVMGDDGRAYQTYTPEMVLGPARKGIKVTYCTDTRPVVEIANAAKDADLFICEGMYAEPEKVEKAKQYKHMTFYEAAELAKKAEPKQMWLTHFSPSLVGAERYMEQVRKIFPASYLGKDGKSIELDFEEDE